MTNSVKYIGMDVHKESISIAVMNSVGKVVMDSVIETKASMILQFIDGLYGDLQVTFEEGTSAAWLYDLLKPHVTKVVVCGKATRTTRLMLADWPSCCASIISLRFIMANMAYER